MYNILVHAHSGLRWVALILLITTIGKAAAGWLGNKPFTPLDNKLGVFTVLFIHVQVVLGFVLYFQNADVAKAMGDMGAAMKDSALRFWAIEHVLTMVFAAVLITVGRAKSKRKETDVAKHKLVAITFFIGLVLILSRIPWPFSSTPGNWF